MSIWFNNNYTIDDLELLGKCSMVEHIGIKFIEIGDDFIKASMPVDHRTNQPYGVLHGGASVVLAETLGSLASMLVIDTEKFQCFGIEVNANHLRSVSKGIVIGFVKPIHIGATTQIWDIRIFDEREKLICISRLSVAVVKKRV